MIPEKFLIKTVQEARGKLAFHFCYWAGGLSFMAISKVSFPSGGPIAIPLKNNTKYSWSTEYKTYSHEACLSCKYGLRASVKVCDKQYQPL